MRLATGSRALSTRSGFTEPQRLVVRDPEAWATTWAAIWGGLMPAPPFPEVDFSREMVVVAALGQSPSSGYDIVIESAEATSRGTLVRLRTISPGRGCITLTVITSPVDVARLPRRDGDVVFEEEHEDHTCG